MSLNHHQINHLQELEAESAFIIRETVAQFERPVLLFSGGKDSIVLVHLAIRAFHPANVPFALLHIDTGHNFPETIEFRDKFISDFGLNLLVGHVQDSIDRGAAIEETGPDSSRNSIQSVTLLECLQEGRFDAAMGGGRRDEEKARAKERIFSHRDEFGQWDPKNQRPEPWDMLNGRKKLGEHFRVFPLSNWTELDVWHYIQWREIQLPNLYFSHQRVVFDRNGSHYAYAEFMQLREHERASMRQMNVRFRTIGDMTCTGAVESLASNVVEVIQEISSANVTERGTRLDDKRSEAAMEDRKREGYF